MTIRRLLIALVFVATWAPSRPAVAGVVVLTNRADSKVAFTLVQPDGRQTRHTLEHWEVLPVPVAASVTIVFQNGSEPQRHKLPANGIYYFNNEGKKLGLFTRSIPGLGPDKAARPAAPPPAADEPVCTIPVKIMVDDQEPMVQRAWEKRYRDRMAAASQVIERHCRVRFEVVAIGRWTSNSKAHDLFELMDEFEQKAPPEPARLVVGFTGQYDSLRDDKHMGGARGPFRSHILIRQWGHHISEPERLEILVHELAHFLGAAHSAEIQSVMRPDVSARAPIGRKFRINFDATNTLVMYLIGQELRSHQLMHLGQIDPAVKETLRAAYKSLAAELPNDPAAPRYLAMLDQSFGLAAEPSVRLQGVILGARSVVQAVAAAAEENARLPDKDLLQNPGQPKRTGDQLTEYYVRRAAAAAGQLHRDVAPGAFLLGLGVGLDDSTLLLDSPGIGVVWQRAESANERAKRLTVLGRPTVRGRRDLAQHFTVSAALAALLGPLGAEAAGLDKELTDSRAGSGFSFADLSADLAGLRFAAAVSDGKISLARLQEGFAVLDFAPDTGGLKEGIPWSDFLKTYGYPPDGRFTRQRDAIEKRILALPGYKGLGS